MEQINARSIFSPATGFGADTGVAARKLLAEHRWAEENYQRCVELLRNQRTVYEAEAGFFPASVSDTSQSFEYHPEA